MPNHTEKKDRCDAPARVRPVHRADEEFMPTCITRLRQSLEEKLERGMESRSQRDQASRRHAPP